MKYGFLGMGIMGRAMAANLIRGGHQLVVWNRNSAACQPLLEMGAVEGESPAAVVAATTITFAMLADPAAAEAVCLGPRGVLEGLNQGQGYVEMSTIDANTCRDLADAVTTAGGSFLEAPVSGSKKPAEDGTLVFLTGGDQSLYHEVAEALDLMGKKRFFLGEAGQGARMKLIVNMIMGGMMASFCEGLGLARHCGLEPEELLEVLGAGAINNPMFAGKGPQILAENFEVAFPLKHMAKDMRLAVELCEDRGQVSHLAHSARDLFALAEDEGFGDEDFSAVFKTIFE